jgi:predicted nucleic acid-binding protein
MAAAGPHKFVLDTNCFVDASRDDDKAAALAEFTAWAAPGLYLSTVVAAELGAGAGSARHRRTLERQILSPYRRRGRLVNPSPAAWKTLGTTLAALVEKEGLVLRDVRRSFVFDILIARSCREIGATLVSRNSTDLSRITKVFSFDFVAPYPVQGEREEVVGPLRSTSGRPRKT